VWEPSGAGSVFSFLPRINVYGTVPDGRRLYDESGSVQFDGSDLPNVELAVQARRGTTYFTTYDQISGVYFEYFAGSGVDPNVDPIFGRVNRRYDTKGNQVFYEYGDNGGGYRILRKMAGDFVNNLTVYFEYANEVIDSNKHAPITKMWIFDPTGVQNSRTVYFEYQDYLSSYNNPYLNRIINPNGCVTQYDPIIPFADSYAMYQLKRELDSAGYSTYFIYDPVSPKSLAQTTEPEGRITYFEYWLGGETVTIDMGRGRSIFLYDTSSLSGGMPMITQDTNALGYTAYHEYDTVLGRSVKSFDRNSNLTYFEYAGSGANQYALTAVISPLSGAQTRFGFNTGSDGLPNYDMVKMIGPRNVPGTFPVVTYYNYDGSRNQTSVIDPLANTTRFGRDSAGRMVSRQDARANTTYFNYGAAAGNLDSQVDPQGNSTYFGYNSFRDLTQQVSSRWPETGTPASFTTYYEFDRLSRRTKTVDPLLNVTYFDWTSRGDLLDEVDARGQTSTNTYDGLRQLTYQQINDVGGALLTTRSHGYDIYKNRVKTQDGLGNSTYFFYDDIDRQTAIQDALQNATYYFYDSVGNRTVDMDARNNSTYYFYDLLSRQTTTRDALGNSAYFFYDLASNRTQAVDTRNNATYYFYDQLDRTQATRDALGNSTYFYFDEVSNKSKVLDARLNPTYFFYDSRNQLASTRDALGNATYYFYDAAGNQTKVTNARGNSRTSSYDTLDRVSAAKDAVGNVASISYDAVGNPKTIDRGISGYGIASYGTSPYGGSDEAATYFFYGGLRRLQSVRNAVGNSTYFWYDLAGNPIAQRNPLLHPTYFGYDALNRLSRIQDSLGATTYYNYDAVGNRTGGLDPDGHTDQTRYDALNRPDAVRFADGGSAYFFYDQVSNRTKEVDPRGNSTYYGYDGINRLTRIQDALARTLYFEYDAVSNRTKYIDAEGASGAYTYDAVNRRTNIAYAIAGSVVSASLRSDPYFVYDQVGNLAQMGDLWGLHQMEYDAGDRLSRHKYPKGSVVYFEYDRRDNLAARVYPGTAGRASGVYDSLDRQTKVQAPSGATAYFSYDAASNLTGRLLGNSAKLDASYDSVERIKNWRYSKSNNAPLTYFDYTRDTKGLITKAVREATYTTYFAYDASDRLLAEIWKAGASEVYGYRYAYDLSGNRTKAKINGSDTYYFYDQANQLAVRGTNAVYATPTYYLYDKNGSLASLVEPSGTTKLAYNAAGLVARMKWKDASATYFFYDGALQRYGMIAAGASAATYFLWDGPNLLQELNADGTVKEEHTNAKVAIPGIGQLVETNRPGQAQAKIYPIMDPRGSITKWIQSDGSTVFASREYDAFGQIIPNSAVSAWPGRFGYQGQAWMELLSADASQRLLLSPTRLYDPVTGRFLQNEPLLKRRVFQHYLYVSQNPLLLVDPSGLQEQHYWGGGIWDPGYPSGSQTWNSPSDAQQPEIHLPPASDMPFPFSQDYTLDQVNGISALQKYFAMAMEKVRCVIKCIRSDKAALGTAAGKDIEEIEGFWSNHTPVWSSFFGAPGGTLPGLFSHTTFIDPTRIQRGCSDFVDTFLHEGIHNLFGAFGHGEGFHGHYDDIHKLLVTGTPGCCCEGKDKNTWRSSSNMGRDCFKDEVLTFSLADKCCCSCGFNMADPNLPKRMGPTDR
jgi:RHS repeat-associated protein